MQAGLLAGPSSGMALCTKRHAVRARGESRSKPVKGATFDGGVEAMSKCGKEFFRAGMSVLTRSCLLGAGLVVTAAACAAAADLPASPAPAVKAPVPTPTFDWTGFYIGGHGSYNWSNSNSTQTNTATGVQFQSTGSSSGWHGGGQIGYDYMMPSHVVVGIMADVSSGASNTTTFVSPVITATTQTDNFANGTVRGRLGYAIDNVLLYGTAGWNWVDGEITRTQVAGHVGNAVAGTVETASASRDGWTVGAGIGYALTPNWNVFTEYRYTSIQPWTFTFPLAQRSTTSSGHTNQIEFGVNYKFDWGATQAAAGLARTR
jgi:outer membrane immunogenic protein